MIDIMIDLETLGTDAGTAPVIAIGACRFDGEGEGFERVVRFESACEGREISPSTVKWWLNQESKAQKMVTRGDNTMFDVLVQFHDWMTSKGPKKEIRVWGNGVGFDINMIRSVMTQYGFSIPWEFWNELDVRTVCALAKKLGVDKRDFPFEGVKHSALADAKHQVHYVTQMLEVLGCN